METSQLTGAGVVILGASAALAVIAVVWAVMSPSQERTATWGSRHGLAVTEANRSLIAGYLRRTRSLQVAGATIGWLSSPLYITVTGRPFPAGDSWVLLAVLGYLLGALAAEVTFLGQPRLQPLVRVATLAPRTLSDYLPAPTVWLLRLLPVATVALALIYALAPRDAQRSVDPGIAFMVAASVLMVVFAGAIDWSLRTIVARPQPAISTDLLAADDAIRASSIHALSAAGIALILLSIGWALVSLGDVIANAQLSELLPWLGAACDIGALFAWIGLGHLTTWRVRREASVVGR